ncbi:MAG: hypothetical protein ACPG32_08075 [Akkermansiaceae bacterium]
MNDREKKLIFLLLGVAFVLATVFAYTTFTSVMQKKKSAMAKNKTKIEEINANIDAAYDRQEEMEWYDNNQPVEGTFLEVQAKLHKFVTQSMGSKVEKKSIVAQSADSELSGGYQKTTMKVLVSAYDPDLYRWICTLQSPKDFRSVTYIKIEPQRNDKTRVDCELNITQWFIPKSSDDNAEDATETASSK